MSKKDQRTPEQIDNDNALEHQRQEDEAWSAYWAENMSVFREKIQALEARIESLEKALRP